MQPSCANAPPTTGQYCSHSKRIKGMLCELGTGPVQIRTIAFNWGQAACSAHAVLEVFLLLHYANHRRTGLDHIEFTCRCTAQVDDSAPTIRTTVCDANQDRLAVVMVSDQHPGAKRQRAVGGGKSVGAGDLAACRASAAVERGATRFSVNWRDGYRHQNDGKRKFEWNH